MKHNDPQSFHEPHKAVESNSKKLVYSKPLLTFYGSVNKLTMGNTGTISDGNKMQMSPTMSSPDVKENIVKVGVHPLGLGLYLFDYKPEFQPEWGYGRQFGVMADEVENVLPEAVCTHPDGYKMVDYAMLGITHSIH